jgi:hypothetical protein
MLLTKKSTGNWMPYGQDPITYIQLFREIAFSVREKTNNTAMVWSPAPVCFNLYFPDF